MDRRALFFVGAALLCFALIPLGLDKYRHVTEVTGGAYLVFAVLSFLDARGRRRTRRR